MFDGLGKRIEPLLLTEVVSSSDTVVAGGR